MIPVWVSALRANVCVRSRCHNFVLGLSLNLQGLVSVSRCYLSFCLGLVGLASTPKFRSQLRSGGQNFGLGADLGFGLEVLVSFNIPGWMISKVVLEVLDDVGGLVVGERQDLRVAAAGVARYHTSAKEGPPAR